MSINQEAQGTIILPREAYKSIKSEIIKTYNENVKNHFQRLENTNSLIEAKAKGKRGDNRINIIKETIKNISIYSQDFTNDVLNPVFNQNTGDLSYNKFKELNNKRNLSIEWSQYSISFNDKNHTVSWNAESNNNTLNHKNNYILNRKLFNLLNGVTWKPGTGGKIIANDEMNRDDHHEGGGSNYILMKWEPKINVDHLLPKKNMKVSIDVSPDLYRKILKSQSENNGKIQKMTKKKLAEYIRYQIELSLLSSR